MCLSKLLCEPQRATICSNRLCVGKEIGFFATLGGVEDNSAQYFTVTLFCSKVGPLTPPYS